MTPIRCLAAVAGLFVLASCTHIEDTRVSSSVLPMQEPTHAAQAPILELDGIRHVGAAAAPPTDALPPAINHGAVFVRHGELPNPVTSAQLVAYLHDDALAYVRAGAEAGNDEQLFPDGLLLRFAADPPLVRVADGTPAELVDEAVRVVQLLNMALPRDWQIGFGDEPGTAGTTDPGPSEIIIAFAAQENWPAEVRPPEGEDIGLALPSYELYATGDPDRPFNLQITGGRIWIDPMRTEGDERLGVIAHEIIHVLGRAHPDPARFPDSIMVAGGGDGPTEHILHPLDRTALFAVYSRVDPGARRTRPTSISDRGRTPPLISMVSSVSPSAKSRLGPRSRMASSNPGPQAQRLTVHWRRTRASLEPHAGPGVFSASPQRPRPWPGAPISPSDSSPWTAI